jgi:hypothetical protein
VFGGYRIEGVAGRGGMGVVYRAVQLDLGRPVALKLIAGDRAADPDVRERFQRESRMAAAIDHPNVVPVHGAGEHDGQLYLVMRYVGGTDLHALIKRDGPLPAERAAAIIAQVASALDAAHAAGLVHRDVKPANVLLSGREGEEHAYLSDFGLTRLLASETHLTETGQWMGTIDFSSPEQLSGHRLDARADVYSLGCVLHAALMGTPPYPRGTFPATMLAHLQDPVPRPSEAGAPAGFDRVMARALAKEPASRYPSAGDLGRAALAAARGESVTESERSVAVGSAAPGPASNGHAARPANGHAGAALGERVGSRAAGPATAATLAAPTEATVAAPPSTRVQHPSPLIPRDPPPPGAGSRRGSRLRREASPPRRRRGRRLWLALLLLAAAAVVAAAAAGVPADMPALGGGASHPNAPLAGDDVRGAAEDFANAYEAEDGAALGKLLTGNVERVVPAGVARGRAEVVRQYQRQFRAQATTGYQLDDLVATGGRAGRASGRYRVERKGGDAIEGRIVFGVVRDHGRPRIALIAITPSS